MDHTNARQIATLIAFLALALAGCGAASASNVHSASSVPSARSTAPVQAIPTASPTLLTYSAPCKTSQLRLTTNRTGAAMGHAFAVLTFTNSSTAACSLNGFPAMRVLNAAGQKLNVKTIAADQAYLWPITPIATIELPPNGAAYFAIQEEDAGDSCVTAATTLIYPPRNTASLTAPIAAHTCDGSIYISPIVAKDTL